VYKKQCDLLAQLFNSQAGIAELPIIFNEKQLSLKYIQYIDYRLFLNDETIPNGTLLGGGGMKRVFNVDGVAVSIVACASAERIEQIINEEIHISQQISKNGIHSQKLNKGTISLYNHNKTQLYENYPCMFSDSFSTLSREKNIEVYDTKNGYRFGTKYKLYDTDEACYDNVLNKIVFQDIINELALLLYLNIEVNTSDSYNLAFMPSNRTDLPSAVKLFMYDFSSKSYNPNLNPLPLDNLNSLPSDSTINSLLKSIIGHILEADSIARNSKRTCCRPDFIDTFFDKTYVQIEKDLVLEIQNKIIQHIESNSNNIDKQNILSSSETKEKTQDTIGFFQNKKIEVPLSIDNLEYMHNL
jgi:hypothetical protein